MPIKKYKPTTNGRRGMTTLSNNEITTSIPEKSLLVKKTKTGGRNNQGRMTVQHIGGGAKQKYRIIDFKRNKTGVTGRVATIEYDPNRNSNIALINYKDGEKRYIIAPKDLKVGMIIENGREADIKVGNAKALKDMPVGTVVHNIELQAGKGGQMVRSAGTSAQLMAKEGNYATLRLPSGEMRYVRIECKATIGTVSNTTNDIINIGKAGRKRHMGWRPTVRGSVMNPCDHPHGGGEGRSPIGRPSPVTPWGKPALGYKTRKNKKYSDRFIIKRRNSK